MKKIIDSILDNHYWLKKEGFLKKEKVIDSLPSPYLLIDNNLFTSFSSNNYLGISKRFEVIENAVDGLRKYTMSTSEARMLGGNLNILEQLEKKIAKYKQKQSAAIFATGLLANVAVIPVLAAHNEYSSKLFGRSLKKNNTIIISDEYNHRSIQMGIKLSGVKHIKYNHIDLKHIEKLLSLNKNKDCLIITDSIFSMNGNLAPLDKLSQLADYFKATIMIDDAHGTGIFGANGTGVAEHFKVQDKIDIIMGTFSKAFGALGGYVVAKKEIIDMIKLMGSGFRFTSSLPAEQVLGIITTIDILKHDTKERLKLWENVYHFMKTANSVGLKIEPSWTPIIPIKIGDEKLAKKLEAFLYSNNIICHAVTSPVVRQGQAIMRVTINSTHSYADIEKLIELIHEFQQKESKVSQTQIKCSFDDFLDNTPTYLKGLVSELSDLLDTGK